MVICDIKSVICIYKAISPSIKHLVVLFLHIFLPDKAYLSLHVLVWFFSGGLRWGITAKQMCSFLQYLHVPRKPLWQSGHSMNDTQTYVCVLRCSLLSDSLGPLGLKPTKHLCRWDSLGKNTGVGGHFLLQGIYLTQ